jgi:hypothetical protein
MSRIIAASNYIAKVFRPGYLYGTIQPERFNYINHMFRIKTDSHRTSSSEEDTQGIRSIEYKRYGHQAIELAHTVFPQRFSKCWIDLKLEPTINPEWFQMSNVDPTITSNSIQDDNIIIMGRFPYRWLHMINDFYLNGEGLVIPTGGQEELRALSNRIEKYLSLFPEDWILHVLNRCALMSRRNSYRYSIQVHEPFSRWSTKIGDGWSELAAKTLCTDHLGSLDFQNYNPCFTGNHGFMLPPLCSYSTDANDFNHRAASSPPSTAWQTEFRGITTYRSSGDINLEEIAILAEVLDKNFISHSFIDTTYMSLYSESNFEEDLSEKNALSAFSS